MIIWRTNLCIQLVYFLYQYNYVNIVPITLKYNYIAFILYLFIYFQYLLKLKLIFNI